MAELGLMVFFLNFFVRLHRRGLKRILHIAILAVFTVSAGELLNAFHSRMTSYSPDFLLWIPGTGIPVFIIVGGAFTSVLLFLSGQIAARSLPHSIGGVTFNCLACTFALSFLLPVIEIAGINLGVWHWNSPVQFGLGWYLGVWKFYLIFVAFPAFAGIALKSFERHAAKSEGPDVKS